MGKGIINYDAVTTNSLLKILKENKDVFPFDTLPTSGSVKGITSGAVKEALQNIKSKVKGYFLTEENLKRVHSTADEGSKAYVGYNYPYAIYLYETDKGGWYDTKQTGGDEGFSAGDFYSKMEIDRKNAELDERLKVLEERDIFLSEDAFEAIEPEDDKLYFIVEES